MLHTTRRQSEILKAVQMFGSCTIGELAADLNVSDETIRRDVRVLVSDGLVVKVHGAIVALDHLREDPFQLRLQENREEKVRIAVRAANLVSHGQSIMLDTGSTTTYVAHSLSGHRNLLAVTNSVEVARSLANQNNNRVYMAGGEIRADDGAAFGETTIAFAARFQVDIVFLSIAAISANGGFMDNELWEADLSQVMIRQASKVMIVADHSKFERRGLVQVCDFSSVDVLITSQHPPKEAARRLAEAEVEVMVV